jgi:hypothetical protein
MEMNKRGYEHVLDDDGAELVPGSKKQKVPALASVIVEALKVDSLQRLCSSLEPLFRRIVSEELERALTRLGHASLPASSSPLKIQGSEGKRLQLHFRTRMPPHLFTGGKVEGEQGTAIHVVLLDANTGCVVQTGPEAIAKLNIVVLEGDFNEGPDEDWTKEQFEGFEVKEREGKRPLLTGDLQVTLKEGVGSLGELTFTDNSSWIRSRKFRLGLKVAAGYSDSVRVRETKTEAFAVKDHRGELYKKHYPPALHDEVWRLDRIAKDGALHKKLLKSEIVSVEDFLRVLVRDPQRLRNILGSGMSNRMWENTMEHAKTCVLGGKLYVYYTEEVQGTGVVFNHIYELRGLITDDNFLSLESLNQNQKIMVDSLVKKAYENWHHVIEYDGKVLNALGGNTKTITAPPPVATNDNNYSTDCYAASAQNREHQYITSGTSQIIQTSQNHASVPQLIEFPFVRTDHNGLMNQDNNNNTQAALPGPSNMDYMSIGTPAYVSGDQFRPRNEQGMENFFADEIRMRSSEMLENDDMQRLLKTFGIGVGAGFGHTDDEACYTYSIPYENQMDRGYEQQRSKSSGKAVVGWLKLKAALRWGIFIRKKAAERRAQLVVLD